MDIRRLDEDKNIVLRLREGDHRAFEVLYNRYKKRLAVNLFKILKSHDLVDDVLQELFARLWQNRRNINVEQPLKSYLFQIARNLCMDIFRKAAKDKSYFEYLKYSYDEAYNAIEQKLLSKEHSEFIENAMEQMPPQRQRIFRLCRLEGKSHKEVGELLGISKATVNAHITVANQQFKDYVMANKGIVYTTLTVLLYQGM